MRDIPLVVLVALTASVGHLIWQNLALREHVGDLAAQLDYKQREVEGLMELNQGLMRERLGVGVERGEPAVKAVIYSYGPGELLVVEIKTEFGETVEKREVAGWGEVEKICWGYGLNVWCEGSEGGSVCLLFLPRSRGG